MGVLSSSPLLLSDVAAPAAVSSPAGGRPLMNPQHLNAVLELSYAIMHAPRRPALSDSLNRAVTLIGAGAVASIFEYLPARAAKLTYLMPPTATGQVPSPGSTPDADDVLLVLQTVRGVHGLKVSATHVQALTQRLGCVNMLALVARCSRTPGDILDAALQYTVDADAELQAEVPELQTAAARECRTTGSSTSRQWMSCNALTVLQLLHGSAPMDMEPEEECVLSLASSTGQHVLRVLLASIIATVSGTPSVRRVTIKHSLFDTLFGHTTLGDSTTFHIACAVLSGNSSDPELAVSAIVCAFCAHASGCAYLPTIPPQVRRRLSPSALRARVAHATDGLLSQKLVKGYAALLQYLQRDPAWGDASAHAGEFASTVTCNMVVRTMMRCALGSMSASELSLVVFMLESAWHRADDAQVKADVQNVYFARIRDLAAASSEVHAALLRSAPTLIPSLVAIRDAEVPPRSDEELEVAEIRYNTESSSVAWSDSSDSDSDSDSDSGSGSDTDGDSDISDSSDDEEVEVVQVQGPQEVVVVASGNGAAALSQDSNNASDSSGWSISSDDGSSSSSSSSNSGHDNQVEEDCAPARPVKRLRTSASADEDAERIAMELRIGSAWHAALGVAKNMNTKSPLPIIRVCISH